ncbi:MAG: type II toxin-antitoxin system HicB family antitoxin [Gammaproteobacteria bacterium]|nr:type II toxin-antitoxin system HicB family antitoxin [Gammaproteobacteria bacterium]
MYKYEIIIYWSNDDQVFVAEVPELSGCVAYGTDQESALKNIKDAIEFRIDRATELGRPIPSPKGVRLMLA